MEANLRKCLIEMGESFDEKSKVKSHTLKYNVIFTPLYFDINLLKRQLSAKQNNFKTFDLRLLT